MMRVVQKGCGLYVTGDYGHHDALDAIDMGLTVIDATHYGLEHIFVHYIAGHLEKQLAGSGVEIIEADMGCPARLI